MKMLAKFSKPTVYHATGTQSVPILKRLLTIQQLTITLINILQDGVLRQQETIYFVKCQAFTELSLRILDLLHYAIDITSYTGRRNQDQVTYKSSSWDYLSSSLHDFYFRHYLIATFIKAKDVNSCRGTAYGYTLGRRVGTLCSHLNIFHLLYFLQTHAGKGALSLSYINRKKYTFLKTRLDDNIPALL